MYTLVQRCCFDNWKEGRKKRKKERNERWKFENYFLLDERIKPIYEYPEASRYYYLPEWTLSYSIILGLMEDSVRSKPSV